MRDGRAIARIKGKVNAPSSEENQVKIGESKDSGLIKVWSQSVRSVRKVYNVKADNSH